MRSGIVHPYHGTLRDGAVDANYWSVDAQKVVDAIHYVYALFFTKAVVFSSGVGAGYNAFRGRGRFYDEGFG